MVRSMNKGTDDAGVMTSSVVRPDEDMVVEQGAEKADEEVIEDPITAKDLYTRPRLMGMPLTYLTVGFVYGGQGALLFPVFKLLLRVDNNYYNAIGSIVYLFWGFKIFYGFLSDSVPILGMRRKPYIFGGWLLSALSTGIQATYVSASSDTTFCFAEPEDGSSKLVCQFLTASGEQCPDNTYYQTTGFDKESFNKNVMVWLMIFTNFSYMFADVAADGLAVQYAKREIDKERGRIQAYNYCCRFLGSTIMALITGFGLNTPLYGGTFSSGIPLSTFLWFLTVLQVCGLPFYFIMEDKKADKSEMISLGAQFSNVWQMLMNRGFATLMIFNVVYNVFTGTYTFGSGSLASAWVQVSPLVNSVNSILSSIAIGIVIYINGRYLSNYSFRCLQSFGLVASTIMGLLSLLIVYDVTRSPALWVFTNVDQAAFYYVGFLVSIWSTTEMAPPGLEGTAISISTTASNAAGPLATKISNLIGAQFENLNSEDNFLEESIQSEVQSQYVFNLFIIIAINLSGLMFLWLLPNQRKEAKRRYENWGSSFAFGIVSLAIILFAMSYGSSTNIQTVICPCLESNDGDGCIEELLKTTGECVSVYYKARNKTACAAVELLTLGA
jgi:hypothetical protein